MSPDEEELRSVVCYERLPRGTVLIVESSTPASKRRGKNPRFIHFCRRYENASDAFLRARSREEAGAEKKDKE